VREIVRLERRDGIPVVRLKLEQAQSRDVALVIPADSALLRSEVSLNAIRHIAQSLALDVVIVTDGRGAALARSLGLRTASSETRAHRMKAQGLGWHAAGSPDGTTAPGRGRPSGTLPTAHGHEPPTGRWRPRPAPVLAAVGVAILLLVGIAFWVPRATVRLDLQGVSQAAEADLVASVDVSEADHEQGLIPARQVRIELVGEETGQATGRKSTPDQYATGEVVFANKTTDEVTVPKGTVVRTSDGVPVRFYTLLDVKVPAGFGATARAPIMAFEPGAGGNVNALTIRVVEGEPSYQVEALNDKPTQGGGDRRESVVAPEDHDRLRASLMQRLQQESYDQLIKVLNPGEWVPPDSLEVAIVEETFDKKVDEPADTVRLTMKVAVTGVAVDGEAVRQVMVRRLQDSGSGSLVVNEATLSVDQPVGKAIVESGSVRFHVRARGLLVPSIDLRGISARIAGQAPQQAEGWLLAEYRLRRPPEIRVTPGWWPLLPRIPSHIQVQLSGGV